MSMNEKQAANKAGYPNGDARDFFLRKLDGKTVKAPKKPEQPGSEPPIMAVYAAPVVKEKK